MCFLERQQPCQRANGLGFVRRPTCRTKTLFLKWVRRDCEDFLRFIVCLTVYMSRLMALKDRLLRCVDRVEGYTQFKFSSCGKGYGIGYVTLT